MPVTKYFWFAVVPLTLIPLVAVLLGEGLSSFDAATAFVLPPAFSAFLSGYTYRYSRSLARVQLASSVLFLVGLCIAGTIEKVRPASFLFGQGTLIYSLVVTWCVSALFFVVSSGVLLVRFFGRTSKIDFVFTGAKSLDISFVRHSFSSIRQAFSAAQESVTQEASFIDEAIRRFQETLDAKEGRLAQLQKEMEQARNEIVAHEALARLSRSERDSFFFMLNRRKRIEYLIGFLLGVLASVVAQLAFIAFRIINLWARGDVASGSFF